MSSFLVFPLLFTVVALFFSLALVDWPRATAARQANFNLRDLLWCLVVACSVCWPIAAMYAAPHWEAALTVTFICLLLAWELMWPAPFLRSWELFHSVPRAAWGILAVFSLLSTWLSLLYFWTEEAQGRGHVGPLIQWFLN